MTDRQKISEQESLHEHLTKSSFIERESKPIQLAYEVSIKAQVKKEQKTILHPQATTIPAQSFTAILGPSGSGKTTLLNFLSGRLVSDNLSISGSYRINGSAIESLEPYSNQIGYVTQEDALLGTLTPRECFRFAADLRLEGTKFMKYERVEELIYELGLTSCADVKIGNTFIKGVSGGERKRTSIGVELITNPNVIFLDEPTTGLDSTTALQVILLLSSLARKGKTIISTIHQPSSELFCEFDRLMLLVDGRCIYSGRAEDSYNHFGKMGYVCPELMNASQFYLDLMSLKGEQGTDEQYQQLKQKHNQNILQMEESFKKSPFCQIEENQSLEPLEREKTRNHSFFYEFYLIFYRSLLCQIRNPMDVGLKIAQSVFTALIVIIVFGTIERNDYQNLRGIAFFLVSQNAFGGIQGTLATFSIERPVFLRERFSKSYSTISYFLARTGCNFPFELIYPTVGAAIVYWVTGMGENHWDWFLWVVITVNCTYFLSSSYGLLYSTLIPKLETAMALVPVLVIPFMLLGGFFIQLDDVRDIRVIFFPIMYLSPFKYGFQAMMLGLDPPKIDEYIPNTYLLNILVMLGIGTLVRIISLIAMQVVSNPRRVKIKNNQ